MKRFLITIVITGFMGYAYAQETPKSDKKTKTKSDTTINKHTNKSSAEKSTYKIDTTKSTTVKKNKKTIKSSTHPTKDSL